MFKDTIVLVTGAASGIGLETAGRFAAQGATVIGVDCNEKALDKAVDNLGNRFIGRPCDIGLEGQISDLHDFVKGEFGRLDVLVNNAGRARLLDPEEISEEDFHYHYDVLLKGPMLLVKYFAPLLRASSNASIVNIASVAARIQASKHFIYSTAKAAIDQFTRHLARDLPGIRSNCILPGLIDTPILKNYGEENVPAILEHIGERVPCGRAGKPEDIADCILFLCSDRATYINGASIVIDGGLMCAADWGV